MKRFFAVLLTAVLLFALMPVASASGTPRFYIEAPSSAKAGDTITVSVRVSGDYTAHLLTLHMDYETGSLEYVSLKRGEVLSAASEYGMAVCEKAPDKPTISVGILYAGDEGLSAEGEIFEAAFKVLNTASSKTELKLTVAEFGYMPLTASTATPISCNVEGATVAISGGSGTPQTTAAPTIAPHNDSTEAAGSTASATASSATAAPNNTGAADDKQTTEAADATGLPELDPNTTPKIDFQPSDVEGKTARTEAADETGNTGDKANSEPSTAVKAVIIGVGCLLAAGLGWLGVHFVKKGRAAHDEAARK